MYKLIIALLISMIPAHVFAQVLPRNNSELNYRIIGFTFPAEYDVTGYKVEVAKGVCYHQDSFQKHIIVSFSGTVNKIVGEVPAFGQQYTWRIVCNRRNGTKTKSSLYHFSTGIIAEVDTNVTRLRVLAKAKRYKDAYVFMDGSRTLYNMSGQPVWYLPKTGKFGEENIIVRDLKLTQHGTITFIAKTDLSGELGRGYEIDYNGDVLWEAPHVYQDDTNRRSMVHHQLTRMHNGHYMALGYEHYRNNMPIPGDSDQVIFPAIDTGAKADTFRMGKFETIKEYDGNGTLVWAWNITKYLMAGNYYFKTDGRSWPVLFYHINAFFFNENEQCIYLSVKDISQVIKIKYPERTMIKSYGKRSSCVSSDELAKGLFCGQHSCRVSDKGYLYLFDNHDCVSGQLPKIVRMKEPLAVSGDLQKVWEYTCTIDGLNTSEKREINFVSGGSVQELPDQSVLACMGDGYGKVFIVGTDRRLAWSALPECRNVTKTKWELIPQYRASIICNLNDLTHLIWHEQIPGKFYLQ